VICRYLLELSESETAVALRIPSGTVKSRLHRALTILRTEVADAVAD
jgi:DNA-directed RNA polymerase specialized sigma24 family protein